MFTLQDGRSHMSQVSMQILKEEEELNKAFGSGPTVPKHKLPSKGDAEPQLTKIMIFGNANQCEVAQRMIQEAIDNKVCISVCPCWGCILLPLHGARHA